MRRWAAGRPTAAVAALILAAALASCSSAATPSPAGTAPAPSTTKTSAVLNVAKLESGSASAVVGALSVGNNGAIDVATSANGEFVFTSLEDTAEVQVSNLARALSAGFKAAGVAIGAVPTGVAPVGETVSPGGQWLYVTSEAYAAPGGAPSPPKGCSGNPDASPGDVRAISVPVAEHDPARALRSVALAASSPVRIALSDDGQLAWVTARGSDALLGFAAARLRTGKPALVADVPVGIAPVGVILADSGRWAVVADSNRFSGGTSPDWLSVVSVPDALASKPALAAQIRAGSFPRELALSPDGRTLYVTNFSSDELETISVAALARAASS